MINCKLNLGGAVQKASHALSQFASVCQQPSSTNSLLCHIHSQIIKTVNPQIILKWYLLLIYTKLSSSRVSCLGRVTGAWKHRTAQYEQDTLTKWSYWGPLWVSGHVCEACINIQNLEFPLWLSSNKPDWYPWGRGFDPCTPAQWVKDLALPWAVV